MTHQRRVTTGVLLLSLLLLYLAGRALALQPGDNAPDFTLPATTAEKITDWSLII